MSDKEMVVLDGAEGEGGGQILRSSLTLSAATGRPFRITRIRANRSKPGLMRQHLTSVQAAARICSAQVEGDAIGSTEITFRPGPLRAGDYRFSVGTAGSTSLVFQTVFPALILAGGPSRLTLEGGTHNSSSPCLDFLDRVFLGALAPMGIKAALSVERRGFYPAGGGRWTVDIHPPATLAPLDILERGEFKSLRAHVLWARIPDTVPNREALRLRQKLGLDEQQIRIEEARDSIGPGNVVMAELRYANATEIVTGFGAFGISSEAVADDVVEQTRIYQRHGAPVGEFLADQLMLPLALGPGGRFRTGPLSLHARTHIEIIGRFLPGPIEVTECGGKQVEIRVPARS
jgi:RNA 3'-terminal phosphate cyclase (ATP)